MSDNPSQSNQLQTLNAGKDEFEVLQRQCRTACISGLLPDEYRKGNADQQLAKAVVVALKGRELGIPMMQAFSQIHVIKGKPAISAELMLALIYRAHPEAKIDFLELSNEVCELEARRPGGKPCKFKFTIEDAKKAELLGNNTWQKYPRAMLRSRAVTEMARTIFPDAIMGCSYTPEELGAEVNDEGEVIQTEQQPTSEPKMKDVGPTPPPDLKTVDGGKNPELTPAQIKRMFTIANKSGWKNDQIKSAMKGLVNKDSTKDINRQEYDFLCTFFNDNKPDQTQDEGSPFDKIPDETPPDDYDFMNGPEPDWDDPQIGNYQ